MKQHKFFQQVMVLILFGLLLVSCATTSTLEPTVEPTIEPTIEPTVEPTIEPTVEPTIEPTVEPTIEPTPEPTLEPTPEPTESAPVGAAVLLLGPEGSYIDMYPQPSSPLTPYLQVPAGVECEILSGPRTITEITLWELDCSWSDECCGEGYGLWGWVEVTNFELIE